MAILATLLIAVSTSVHAPTFSTLVNFDNTHGRYSFTPPSQGRDGNLYGTIGEGGANSFGTVFKLTPKGKLTLLYSFGGTEPQYPCGLLLGKDGNFYGTTYNGGANGVGAVFKVTPTGKLTTLHSFDTTDGSHPWGVWYWATTEISTAQPLPAAQTIAERIQDHSQRSVHHTLQLP
jgi:uncharacterized repeat protein (TIGR03803 family)